MTDECSSSYRSSDAYHYMATVEKDQERLLEQDQLVSYICRDVQRATSNSKPPTSNKRIFHSEL